MQENRMHGNILTIRGLIIWGTVILVSLSADAKNFGIKGHTYQIIEQPFLQMIDERLKKVDMQKEQVKMTSIVKDRVRNPRAVEGLKPATKNRIFYFDPTYILEEDAVLPCGRVLHKAGTKINPLEHMDLNRRLFFIDSREPGQIGWLKGQLASNNKTSASRPSSKKPMNNSIVEQEEPIEDRIILVGGSVFKLKEDLSIEYQDKVYFDQDGELTTRFGIKSSPAVAMQDGLMLRIEEIKLTK